MGPGRDRTHVPWICSRAFRSLFLGFSLQCEANFLISHPKSYVVGTQKYHLNETVLRLKQFYE